MERCREEREELVVMMEMEQTRHGEEPTVITAAIMAMAVVEAIFEKEQEICQQTKTTLRIMFRSSTEWL